jgi:hypothetical protein
MTTMDNTPPAPQHDPDKPFHVTLDLRISPTAAALVRTDFNPSNSGETARLKLLAAAFISLCEEIRDRGPAPAAPMPDRAKDVPGYRRAVKLKDGSRCAALGITNAEQAAMWAVKAATAAL